MKKIFGILITLFFGIIMIFSVAGCNKEPAKSPKEEETMGTFYTLQEAYDNGYLTKTDLESIAYYHNNNILYSQSLNAAIADKIKKTAAFKLCNQDKSPIIEAKAEDFVILKFYGSYNGCYMVIINDPYSEPPAAIRDFWDEIAGVRIHYRGYYDIVGWEEKI